MDRYVHFSGPIFVYEIHFKKPPEFASLASILMGKRFDMLFEIAKSVETVIILGKTVILP